MKRATILALYLTACFHDSEPVDPVIEGGTGSGSSGGDSTSGNGPDGSWSGSGTSTDSTSTSPDSFTASTDSGTSDESTGNAKPYPSPCDEQCTVCFDIGSWSACADECPAGTEVADSGLCYWPCDVANDTCPEETTCVYDLHSEHGEIEACLWPA